MKFNFTEQISLKGSIVDLHGGGVKCFLIAFYYEPQPINPKKWSKDGNE